MKTLKGRLIPSPSGEWVYKADTCYQTNYRVVGRQGRKAKYRFKLKLSL
jgi:hypothetical protein